MFDKFCSVNSVDSSARIFQKFILFLKSQNSFLKQIGVREVHCPYENVYFGESDQLVTENQKVSSEYKISLSDIENFSLENACVEMYECANSFMEQMERGVLGNLDQICDFTGNTVDVKGKPISREHFLEVLETIHIDFDKDGKPKLPSLVASPALYEEIVAMGEESDLQKKKVEKVIERKRKAFYAEKGSRRLSRID